MLCLWNLFLSVEEHLAALDMTASLKRGPNQLDRLHMVYVLKAVSLHWNVLLVHSEYL